MAALHPTTLRFLASLKKNNNKPWFEKNRKLYEVIRSGMMAFTEELIRAMNAFDSTIGFPDPRSCLFRINRDVRFSKDKSPYKTSMGIAISKAGKNFEAAGYYLHLEPGKCFVGGGMWMPQPDQLKKVRQEIDYNFNDFKKIVEASAFRKKFGGLNTEMKLSRPPKGYDEHNPAIEYMKLKSFTVGAEVTDAQVLYSGFVKDAAKVFKEMNPFIRFLNEAVK
jgi:uncharacterized protein (TIGR02453 family)